MPLEEPQDVVGVVQRERVNDQPAHPECRVAECRARVYRHRVQLEGKAEVTLDDLSGEPFIALPATAGPLRQFWLAAEERQSPPRIAAEAETAEETFEAVASGLGVALLAAGNAELYQRSDVVCRPVTGLSPSQLAVLWRTDDDRKAIRVFSGIFCRCVQAGG